MKYLVILFTIFFNPVLNMDDKEKSFDRHAAIQTIVMNETEIAKARCFCRIGDRRGSRENEYPNALHDLGTLRTYRGINPVNQKNDDDCGRRCSDAASRWANSLTDDQLCNYFKKNGTNTLVAYAKVGGKKWSIRQTIKSVKCCNSSGTLICPSGSHSQHNNFPGYCAIPVCKPAVNGDRRLYNENGSAWGLYMGEPDLPIG